MGATGYIIKGSNGGRGGEAQKEFVVSPADGTIDVEKVETFDKIDFRIKTTYDGYETINVGSPASGGYFKAAHIKFNEENRRYRLVCILNGGSYTPVAKDFAIYYIKFGWRTGGVNADHWYIEEYSRQGNGAYVSLEQIALNEYNVLIHTPTGYSYANIGILKEDKESDVTIDHFNNNTTRYTPTGTIIETETPEWKNGAPAISSLISSIENPVVGQLGHYNGDRNLYFFDGTNWRNVYSLVETNPEDLTISNGLLQLADRSSINGLGYIILRPDKTFAEQVVQTDCIYEIRYNFDFAGAEVTIPANCVLQFDGGCISNGTLNGTNTCIKAPINKIFGNNLIIGGTWVLSEAYPEWFDAKGDGISDDTDAMQRVCDSFPCVKISNRNYKVTALSISNVCIFGESKISSRITTTQGLTLGFQTMLYSLRLSAGTASTTLLTITNDGLENSNAQIVIDNIGISGYSIAKMNNNTFLHIKGVDAQNQGIWNVKVQNVDTIERQRFEYGIRFTQAYNQTRNSSVWFTYMLFNRININWTVHTIYFETYEGKVATENKEPFADMTFRNITTNYSTSLVDFARLENVQGVLFDNCICYDIQKSQTENPAVRYRFVDASKISSINNIGKIERYSVNLFYSELNMNFYDHFDKLTATNGSDGSYLIDNTGTALKDLPESIPLTQVDCKRELISAINLPIDLNNVTNNLVGLKLISGAYINSFTHEFLFGFNSQGIPVITRSERGQSRQAGVIFSSFYLPNGTTVQRPNSNSIGYFYFDTTLGKPIWWDGLKWVDATGNNPELLNKGTSAQRPTLASTDAGFQYFDTDLGKPIYWTGAKWVDATGTDLQ